MDIAIDIGVESSTGCCVGRLNIPLQCDAMGELLKFLGPLGGLGKSDKLLTIRGGTLTLRGCLMQPSRSVPTVMMVSSIHIHFVTKVET